MVCCLWVLMTQETHGQIDIAQISPVSSFQRWNTLSLDSSPRWASLSQVPSVTPPDSVYYTAYTSLKPTTVNLSGKKENICSTKHSLNCLPWIAWPAVPESRTLAASFFSPTWSYFPPCLSSWVKYQHVLFPSLFLWWEVYRGSIDKNKLSCIILSCLVISVLLGGF